MENNFKAVSPTEYAKIIGVSRQMVHQYIRDWNSGKSEKPENVAKTEKMGNRHIIYIHKEMLKDC